MKEFNADKHWRYFGATMFVLILAALFISWLVILAVIFNFYGFYILGRMAWAKIRSPSSNKPESDEE